MGNQPAASTQSAKTLPNIQSSRHVSTTNQYMSSSEDYTMTKTFASSTEEKDDSLCPVYTPSSPDGSAHSNVANNHNKQISTKIIEIAANFWNSIINGLSSEDQLEIGVAIYMGMIVKDKNIKRIFKKNMNDTNKIAVISMKFLNMTGWLIRSLLQNSQNLPYVLSNLGKLHKSLTVESRHFGIMLESLHETFAYYFPIQYKMQEQYAMDYIFSIATRMMLEQDVISKQVEDTKYLQSLDICLQCDIGRDYLFRFLQQTMCDEMVIYLQSMMRFRNQTSDKGRFMIARNIIELSIDSQSSFSLNISHQCRQDALDGIKIYQKRFLEKDEEFKFPLQYFKNVTMEVNKLILDNHWRKFTAARQNIHIKQKNEDSILM